MPYHHSFDQLCPDIVSILGKPEQTSLRRHFAFLHKCEPSYSPAENTGGLGAEILGARVSPVRPVIATHAKSRGMPRTVWGVRLQAGDIGNLRT